MQLYNKMKSALTFVLFRLFTIGVCVDGNEVSVTEGDSVTLKSGVTERQTDDGIEWRFDVTRIAKISRGDSGTWVKPDGLFKDRLQLDNQTGDLKISNISTTDSGEYNVKISSPRGSPEVTFSVKVVSAAVVESVSVKEGDPVTLHTDLTEIKRDDVIQWRFGQQKSPVAEINRKSGIFKTYDGPDDRFRDRLKLDHQTGSLNITNTRTTDSGLYEVTISSSSSRYTRHYTRSFGVTVSDVPGPGLSPAVPDPGWSSAAVAWFGVGFLLGAAAGVFYYRYKRSKKELSEKQLSVLYEQLKVIHMRKEASKTQQSGGYVNMEELSETQQSGGYVNMGESAGSGPKNSSITMAVEELYEKLEELFKNQSQLSDEHVPLNSNVSYVPDHPPSPDNGEMEELYEKLGDNHIEKDASPIILPLGNGDPGNEENEYSNG